MELEKAAELLFASYLQKAVGIDGEEEPLEYWKTVVDEVIKGMPVKPNAAEFAMASLVLMDLMYGEKAINKNMGELYSGADRVLLCKQRSDKLSVGAEPALIERVIEEVDGEEEMNAPHLAAVAAGILAFTRQRFFPFRNEGGRPPFRFEEEDEQYTAEVANGVQVRLQAVFSLALTGGRSIAILATNKVAVEIGVGAVGAAEILGEIVQCWFSRKADGAWEAKGLHLWSQESHTVEEVRKKTKVRLAA